VTDREHSTHEMRDGRHRVLAPPEEGAELLRGLAFHHDGIMEAMRLLTECVEAAMRPDIHRR
jgi:superfamily II RNA helicase